MPKPSSSQQSSSEADVSPVGSQEQYDRFLPQALKLADAEVRPLRADVNLAVLNARRGIDVVLAHAAAVRELPNLTTAKIEEVGDIGAALSYAAGQVDRYVPQGDVKELVSRASKLRSLLLGSAEALAVAGILQHAQVEKIRKGQGSIDMAGDCVALATLFQKNAAAVKGKVPFTTAQVREAADLGSRLLAVLRPKGAKKAVAKDLAAATDARDRLWTLFEKAWEQNVWRAGAWVFGRSVDEQIPALQSRTVAKRPAKVTPPVATA